MKNIVSYFNFKTKKFSFLETFLPEIKESEVLVEIKASALCGTDLHIMDGDLIDKAYDKKNIILGHEWAGIIVKKGKKVKKFKIGEKVFGSPHIPCGKCAKCKRGEDNYCDFQAIFGLSLPGSHAKFLLAPETTIFKMPNHMNFSLGSLLGDTISTAYHACNKTKIKTRDKILILGTGPVGLTIGLILKLKKVKNIFVMENESYRFSLAKKLFNAKRIAQNNFLKNRRTFNFVFDTTGSKDALGYGFESLARGGELILVGVHNEKYPLNTLRMMYREISIKGCFGYTRKEAKKFIELSKNKSFQNDLKKIITHEFSLKEINRAYGVFRSKKSGKVVLIDYF
jgi:2-desacetyl-2-hydroxyethyl bacteriochlorophyllide A dehydrogenase